MAIDVVVEEVADNLEEIADATRAINTTAVGYFIGGFCIGAGIGFFFGYRFNRERIKAEAFKQSEEEVEKLRDLYQQKTVAAQVKPSVDSIVEEKGYSVKTPEHETPSDSEFRLTSPVPMSLSTFPTTTGASGGFTTHGVTKAKDEDWNYPKELMNRTPEFPYVIHQDEFHNAENEYTQVTYTYYAQDDVLTGDDDIPVPHPDLVVGQNNLKWGHGADDIDVVFVRNDKLELEMEICRVPSSYEQEVLGLDKDEEN